MKLWTHTSVTGKEEHTQNEKLVQLERMTHYFLNQCSTPNLIKSFPGGSCASCDSKRGPSAPETRRQRHRGQERSRRSNWRIALPQAEMIVNEVEPLLGDDKAVKVENGCVPSVDSFSRDREPKEHRAIKGANHGCGMHAKEGNPRTKPTNVQVSVRNEGCQNRRGGGCGDEPGGSRSTTWLR